jgi:hypothetical protein
VISEIRLEQTGETRTATARNKGIVQLELTFRPGITRALAPWEQQFADSDEYYAGDFYLLVPAGRGPRAQKVIYQHATTPRWAPEQGMVRVQADPGEAWAALIPDEREFPGSYNHFVGGASLIAERLD